MGAVAIIGGAVVAERLQDAAPDFLRFVQPRRTIRHETLRRRWVFVQPEDQKREVCCDAGSVPATRVSAATLPKTLPAARPWGRAPATPSNGAFGENDPWRRRSRCRDQPVAEIVPNTQPVC